MSDVEKYLSGRVSWSEATEDERLLGYQAMADDREAEKEALESCEALTGDSYEPDIDN